MSTPNVDVTATDNLRPRWHSLGVKGAPTNYLKQWRELAEMSQEALGKVIGISKSAVNKLESGERALTIEKREKFAEAIGSRLGIVVNRDDLLCEAPDSATVRKIAQTPSPQPDQPGGRSMELLETIVDGLVHAYGLHAVLQAIGKATELKRPDISAPPRPRRVTS